MSENFRTFGHQVRELFEINYVSDICVLLTLERSPSSGRMLFRRQDFRSYWNHSMEQFAARLETVRTDIRPVQAVTEEFWTVRPRRSVNSFNCAV